VRSAGIAAIAGNGKRQTPNAFLIPPTNETLFDVLLTSHQSSITAFGDPGVLGVLGVLGVS